MFATTAGNTIAFAPNIDDFIGEVSNTSEIIDKALREHSVTSQALQKRYLAEKSSEYGVDYNMLYKIVHCESSWRADIVGDGGLAYGLFQFHKPTFKHFCKGDYYHPLDQIDCAVEMFSQELESHWTCHKLMGYN